MIGYDRDLLNHISPGPAANPIRGIVAYVHAVADLTEDDRDRIGILIAFGWYHRIKIKMRIKGDVREGSNRLMRLIYKT